MKKILIIGATSSIAEQCARIWAERGYSFYLVARNEERVKTIAADLRIRGATQVAIHCADLNDLELHDSILNKANSALNGLDLALIAHGILSNQKKCEQSVKETLDGIKTNALSTISLLTLISNRFESQRSGLIAVLSSVAGDRGRASNYVYGSAKAMINAFTSGLRQRLCKSNVDVVTIKLGFVDSPMTTSFKKGLLWVKPYTAAKKIIVAVDARKSEVYVPAFWFVIMILIKAVPSAVFKKRVF